MDELWTSLPRGAVLVCAGVLMAGAPAVAAAGQRERSDQATKPVPEADPMPDIETAPTCGPCCHGAANCGPDGEVLLPEGPADGGDAELDEHDDQDQILETAPTCHGGGPGCGPDETLEPPPVEPKRGCAIVDADSGEQDDPGPEDLALLGPGALALGLRRRRDP